MNLSSFPARVAVPLICILNACAWADSAPPAPPSGQPPAPPPEAVAACMGKSAGTEVTFAGPRGEQFTGVCRQFGDTLAAAPAGGPPPGPPPAR